MLDDSNYLKNKSSLFELLKDLAVVLETEPESPSQSLIKTRGFKNLIVISQSVWQRLAFQTWQVGDHFNLPVHYQDDLSWPAWADQDSLAIGFLKRKDLQSVLSEQNTRLKNYLLFAAEEPPVSHQAGYPSKSAGEERFSFYPALKCWHYAGTQLKTAVKSPSWQKIVADFKPALESWRPANPARSNLAKRLAYEIVGKTPVILSPPAWQAAAQKWKLNFNASNRQLAWSGVWSPRQTMELQAWQDQIFDKNYCLIYLSGSADQSRQSFLQAGRQLSGKMPTPHLIEAPAALSPIQQLIWLSLLADFTAVYMTYLNR